MAWLDDDWAYWHPITIYRSGSTASVDVDVVIPAWWDRFWAGVQSSGADIRVTLGDGVTEVDYQLSGFNKANRTGTIQLDGVSLIEDTVEILYLYWGNDTATAPGHSFTPSSPIDGFIYAGAPGPNRITAQRPAPSAVVPEVEVGKWPGSTLDTYHLWWDWSEMLAGGERINGRPYYEQPSRVYEGSGASASGMYQAGSLLAKSAGNPQLNPDQIRATWAGGRFWLLTEVTLGNVDNDYTLRLHVGSRRPWTGSGEKVRSEVAACTLLVRTLTEP